jgi:biopolymer transport protein ExbD/biopolymer transport protein TolR
MAFGRFDRRTGSTPEPLSGINVTPLVDVMLVLVVILILAAPVLAAALRVQLPQAQGTTPVAAPTPQQALALEVDAQGRLSIDGEVLEEAALRERLAALAGAHADAELQLRADAAVPYGRVVAVMGWAHAAGLTRIGFVAEPVRKP